MSGTRARSSIRRRDNNYCRSRQETKRDRKKKRARKKKPTNLLNYFRMHRAKELINQMFTNERVTNRLRSIGELSLFLGNDIEIENSIRS